MADEQIVNKRRIAKNTLFLYFRTFITMIVGLYTGRVMLQALGVENYGINSVVGGVVAMSTIFTGCTTAAISRYITYTLGTGDKSRQMAVFSTAINAQIVVSIVVALLIEAGGIWFLNCEANIPNGRMYAANWVLHCSVVSLVISLISSAFSAIIVAHEKMSIYAYTSMADATLKLLICFAIQSYDGDRLIFYSLLQVCVSLSMQLFYGWYCRRSFETARYKVHLFDSGLLKEMSKFVSYNLLGQLVYVLSTQGVSMLINVFFGVVFNAARAVACTVNGTVQAFVGNFTMSFNPQMVKSYAAGDVEQSVSLANLCTRVVWLMMWVFIVPICIEADTLLRLWLGEAPPMAALFLRLAMFESLAISVSNSYLRLAQADGRIKRYMFETAIYGSFIFPFTWLLFTIGAPVWSAYVVFIFVYFSMNLIVVRNIKRLMNFSIRIYLLDTIYPCFMVSIFSFILPLSVAYVMPPTVLRFFVIVPISVVWTILCVYVLGLKKNERVILSTSIRARLRLAK